jgi:hypothetical protein
LADKGAVEPEEAAPANVPEHAPPVYHYLGVVEMPEASPAEDEEAPVGRIRSLFRRHS